jgi:hypothetical protein
MMTRLDKKLQSNRAVNIDASIKITGRREKSLVEAHEIGNTRGSKMKHPVQPTAAAQIDLCIQSGRHNGFASQGIKQVKGKAFSGRKQQQQQLVFFFQGG